MEYKEQIQTIYDFLKRSETEQQHPFAYEIYLLIGLEETPLTSRTSGTDKFNQDIENGVGKAKQSHGILRVDTFRGKSANAKSLNSYTINVNGLLTPQKQALEKDEIQSLIDEKISQMPQPQNGFGNFNNLLGILTGTGDGSKDIEGLFGLFNTISGGNKEIDRITYQKQLDDFKYEARFNALQEKYEKLRNENAELKVEKEQVKNYNKELKTEKTDLEDRLSGYAPQEVMKRVAVGVISGIGGRLLSNSPKTAELLGLTQEELKGALGIVDEVAEETNTVLDTNVEITEVVTAQTPEDKKKATIIKNLSDALVTWELQDVAKIANIVGLCLDKAELINKTLAFLSQSVQSEKPENKDLDNEN